MAKIKTAGEIDRLRESGKRLARILSEVKRAIKPGISTKDLDSLAERLIREGGDVPPFLRYTPRGATTPFPASLCVSLNDEIVHGIPSAERIVKDGDVVSIDLGLSHEGMITDAALTVPVGSASAPVALLINETERALIEGIHAIRPGGHIGDISAAIERVAKSHGYGIVRELGGHGVGHHVHEDPYVPNYGRKGTGPILKEGMVLALEPMFMLGRDAVRVLPDGYTVVSDDGSTSAHFEHTVVITNSGADILTEIS
jgi:methionyl aminopeptidase